MNETEQQLKRIESSEAFRGSPQLQRLLRFLVTCPPGGAFPTQYEIATRVLGRTASFDPESDPIVRVEMRRLRQRLADYYRINPHDPLQIRMTPRRYEPIIERNPERNPEPKPAPNPNREPNQSRVPRVAVLPFQCEGGDSFRDSFFLGAGLASDLIHELGRRSELAPLSRTTVFALHARGSTAEELARETGADWILEGTLRGNDSSVQLRASLIRSDGMTPEWHREFASSTADLPSIPAVIAAAIQKSVAPQAPALAIRRTATAAAHLLYLRGLALYNERRTETTRQAIDLFQQAIQEDPLFIRPRLALLEALILPFATGLQFEDAAGRGRRLAADCMALDPESADSINAAGFVKLACDGNWGGAAAEFRKSIDREPHNTWAYHMYPMFLAICGDVAEALRFTSHALRLDPLSPVLQARIGFCEFHGGHLRAAIASFEEGIRKYPHFSPNYYHQAIALAFVGEGERAIRRAEEAELVAGANPMITAARGFALACGGFRDAAIAIAGRLEVMCSERLISPLLPAFVFSAMGNRESTVSMLRLALERESYYLLPYLSSPLLASLHKWDGLNDILRFVNCPVPLPEMKTE